VVFNDYGPAEVTVSVCANPIEPGNGKATIGSIYANSMVSVDTMSVGIDADLQLHGLGVAQGYRGLAGQTASRFLPSTVSGRMYSTGDLAHYTLSRDVVFVGRRDFQVKINGQRMELGEVEGVIREQISVLDCVVVAVKSSTGRLRLTAFVHEAGVESRLDDVQSQVQSSLPRFMWPSRYVRIDSVRRTASGKKDSKWYMKEAGSYTKPSRDANTSLPRAHSSSLPPKFARLARVWESVLGTDEIEATTNFFEAGGDSISGIRLVSEIRIEFPESSFTVKDAIENPTLGGMLKRVIQRSGGALVDNVEIAKISRSLSNGTGFGFARPIVEESSLTKLRRSHSTKSVICFPGLGWLGGEFSDFVELSQGYNVLVANPPVPGEELKTLVARIGDELVSRKDSKLVLLGHSMGGHIAHKVAKYMKMTQFRHANVVAIDTHNAVPYDSLNVPKMVDDLLGDAEVVSSATSLRFATNAQIMNEWVEGDEMDTECEGAIVVEAGNSSGEQRRVKVGAETTFRVPRANHFSILKWPHVLNVVSVVQDLLDIERDEYA
jgi:hypothetical protein